ncbi:MAG TPA: lipid-binding SYLF domain-containing protein [Blastocatellia bacterium]|nr:lipid-binding SYLF domain-containing protein [Blastocatellia bacterium]
MLASLFVLFPMPRLVDGILSEWRIIMIRYSFGVLTLLLLAASAATAAPPRHGDRSDDLRQLRRATEVFTEIMNAPDKGIPTNVLDKAECVAIVPDMSKGGIGVGGRYGKGVVMCRNGRGWTPPSFLVVEGGSFGLQLGFEKVDLVMLVMNRHGMEELINDKFTIGADAAAAAGPVGRNTSAETDVKLDAEILTYSRAKGLFGGLSLNGAVVKQNRDEIRRFYGKDITAKEILMDGAVPMPAEARSLESRLSRTSPEKE